MKKVLFILIFLFIVLFPLFAQEAQEEYLQSRLGFSLSGFFLPPPFQNGYGVEIDFDFVYGGFFLGGGYFWRYNWGWDTIYQMDFGFLGIELFPVQISKSWKAGLGIVFLPEFSYPDLLVHSYPFINLSFRLQKKFFIQGRVGKEMGIVSFGIEL